MAHYARILATVVLLVFAAGGAVWRWRRPGVQPLYEETARLDHTVRARLRALRDEDKFQPDDTLSPPYPGPRGPNNRAALSGFVDTLIDDILAEADGPLEASRRPAADVARLHGYLIEVWYILGYRSATGYFPASDDAPPGWGEPLPPGWASPDRPRLAVDEGAPPQPAVNGSGAP